MDGGKIIACRPVSDIKEKIEFHQVEQKRYEDLCKKCPNDNDFRMEMLRHMCAWNALDWVLVSKDTAIKCQFDIDINIESIEMSMQLYNGLKKAGINRLSEMRNIKMKQFLSIRGFGKKRWQEMQDIINR